LAFFVTRARRRFQFTRRYSHPVDLDSGLRCDQTIITTGQDSATDYPQPLRRIVYFDAEHDRRLIFLTNSFELPALTIARLYKARWQVELFFKWIKQHLRIKAFYGTSENAVKTQVWIAITVYVLVAIVKKRLDLPQSLYTILQVLSVAILEKTPILEQFTFIRSDIHRSRTILGHRRAEWLRGPPQWHAAKLVPCGPWRHGATASLSTTSFQWG